MRKDALKSKDFGYITLSTEIEDGIVIPYRVFCGLEIRSHGPLFYKDEVDALAKGAVPFPDKLHISHRQHIQSVAHIVQLSMNLGLQSAHTVHTYQPKPTSYSSAPQAKQSAQINMVVKAGDILNGIHVVHQEYPGHKLGIMDSANAYIVGNNGFIDGGTLHSMYQRTTDLIVSETEFARQHPKQWVYTLTDINGQHTLADPIFALPIYHKPFLQHNQTLCHNNLTVFMHNDTQRQSVLYQTHERYQIAIAMSTVPCGTDSQNEEERRQATEKLAESLKGGMKAELEALKAAKAGVVLASAYGCGASHHHEKTVARLFWEVWHKDGYYKDFKAIRFFMPEKQAKIFMAEFDRLASQVLGVTSIMRQQDGDLLISGTPNDIDPNMPTRNINNDNLYITEQTLYVNQKLPTQLFETATPPNAITTTASSVTTNMSASITPRVGKLLDLDFSQPAVVKVENTTILPGLQEINFNVASEPIIALSQNAEPAIIITSETTSAKIQPPIVTQDNAADNKVEPNLIIITTTTATTALPGVTAAANIHATNTPLVTVTTEPPVVRGIQEEMKKTQKERGADQ